MHHYLRAKDLRSVLAGGGHAPSVAMRDGLRNLLNSRGIGYDSSKVLSTREEAEWQDLFEFLKRQEGMGGFLVETGFYPKMLAYLLDRPERPWMGVLSVQPRDDLWPAKVVSAPLDGDVFPQGVERLFDTTRSGRERVRDRKLDPYLVE